jgi:hypothetical protein
MKAIAVLKLTPLLIALTFLTGCTPSTTEENGSLTCGGGKPCSWTMGIKVTQSTPKSNMAPADLATAMNAGYEIIITVPSNELTLDPNSTSQATLTATTDTGYTASILENMTFVSSAPSTLVSGDTGYTFSLPASDALTNWVNSVNLNTSETITVAASSSTTFVLAGVPGTYTAYFQIASPQIGSVSRGESTFTDTTSTSGCPTGTLRPGAAKITCPVDGIY